MEIIREPPVGDWVELHVSGRIDSYWADHFKAVLEDVVRGGTYKVRLDLAGVSYLSSVGLGALVWCHKHLQNVRGQLLVTNPSDVVREVLEVTRLGTVLAIETPALRAVPRTTVAPGRRVEREQVGFEVFGRPADRGLACRPVGDPRPLGEGGFGPDDCRRVSFPPSALGVGLGALGKDFSDCRDRFGEFVVAAGAAAYLPTDGSNVPDYLVTAAGAGAELHVCYGLVCEGALSGFARFETQGEAGRVPLSALVQGYLDLARADRIGLVLVAESAGLMGAALRRSPVSGAVEGSPFAFPRVRDWLTITTERAYRRSTVLVVGVASRGSPGALAPLLRPLDKDETLWGHYHAAAFFYRPLPRGELELSPTVTALFERDSLQGILHLVADHRKAVGLGESEFVRGGGWFAPITELVETGG
jgi:anti-anti-sigma factor